MNGRKHVLGSWLGRHERLLQRHQERQPYAYSRGRLATSSGYTLVRTEGWRIAINDQRLVALNLGASEES